VKYVISLGGSIINPGIINTGLLKELKKILKQTKHELVIVCGGGRIARDYIKAGKELGVKSTRLDVIGMQATELNAEIVASTLEVKRARTLEEVQGNLSVTNGLFPGVTTDFDSVVIAGLIGASVINVSNVPGVYDKDPRKHSNAKLLKTLSHKRLIELASEYELGQGANFIFDLAASKLAARDKIKVIFIQGMDNLKKVLNKNNFTGTIVE